MGLCADAEADCFEEQWPDAPFDFAKWLKATSTGTCLKALEQFDRGLPPNTFKNGRHAVPQKHVFAHQLKTLAIVYVFMDWDAPMVVFQALGDADYNQLGVVSRHVKLELQRHFAMPPSLHSVSQCLRPDIVNMALKIWGHSPCADEIDGTLDRVSSEKWEFNPYCTLGTKVLQILEWVGAAMLITGRKRDADIVIGPTFIITTRKDRMATLLVLMICAQNNRGIRSLLQTGPRVFHSILAMSAIF